MHVMLQQAKLSAVEKKITLTKLQICDLTITVRETQTSVQQNNKKLLFKILFVI